MITVVCRDRDGFALIYKCQQSEALSKFIDIMVEGNLARFGYKIEEVYHED